MLLPPVAASPPDLPSAAEPPPTPDEMPPLPTPPPTAAATAPELPVSFTPSPAASPGPTRTAVLTLHQLGAAGPLNLNGTSPLGSVPFAIRADEVVVGATLTLSGAMSPAMIPGLSNDTITLNGQYVGTVPSNPAQPRFEGLRFPVDPVFFTDNNRLDIRFTGRAAPECDDPLSGLLWSTISDSSTLTLSLERLPPQRDLARLPLPFADGHDSAALELPFVLPASPSDEMLTASAIAASWLGGVAGERGAHFPVADRAPAAGNAVLVTTERDEPAGLALPPMSGPTLAVIPNPNDPAASLLVVGGRTGAEAVAAATTLALGSRLLGGAVATVTAPDAPYRQPYDAPAWLPTNRPVKLGELVDAASLEGTGYVPGAMRVPFRTAPDLYTWRNRPFPLEVEVRAPPAPVTDLATSRLDVSMDGLPLRSLKLSDGGSDRRGWLSRVFTGGVATAVTRVDVPAYSVSGHDVLQFFFDTRPTRRGACTAIPEDLHEAVGPGSTIDLSGAYRVAELPNLAYFTNSGFPFTRLADLADTAVVLAAQPSADEVGALLDLMGRFGLLTGYPVTRVAVVRPGAMANVSGRNLLLLATTDDLGAAAALLDRSPYHVTGNRLQVSLPSELPGTARPFGDPRQAARASAVAAIDAVAPSNSAAIVGAPSPFGGGRSVVALLGGSPAALGGLLSALRDPVQSTAITGDLALLAGGRISSYRVGASYTVGSLPPWVYPFWLLRDQPGGGMVAWCAGGLLLMAAALVAVRRRAARRSHKR